MNPITKAMDELKRRIPVRIINEAFKESVYSWRSTAVNVEEQILNKVIRSRVLVDCNLIGGTEILVSLAGLQSDYIDNATMVFHIPKDRTNNRSITSVKSVGYMNSSVAYNQQYRNSANIGGSDDVLNAAAAVMNSHSSAPIVSTANVTLIGENTIMIKESNWVLTNNHLRCVIENDDQLSHLQPRSILPFCKLVELAVKSHIYNELIINMGDAYLSGGQELGIFKTVVEGYADAEQMYQDYLRDKWEKIMFMNDNMTMTRHMRLLIGSQK